ncbi:MAG TPA: glycosyltransferase family A protein, partial [Acidimicrobiia bacterium]|nr:glycosyltransferase family A protein [Acidimicrobiia bacterium]
MNADGRGPLLAVVIPVYCQGQYLADSVLSATRQTVGPIRVVVVDDGCPTEITRREARWLADAFPETVTYLRTSNRGVAHARNFGARFALEAWPTVQAICFLDADDRLSSHSLDALWKALDRSPTSVGWAYANLEYFGDRLGAWNIPRPFSRFRELFENQSGMGCLVHRRVFDAGLYFEGDTTATYEDWEFFIRAMQLGFSGVHTGSIGVRYRVRGNSRLAECLANYDDLYAQMTKRNRGTFDPRERTRREHDELPRFALVSLDKARVWLFTNPLAPRRTYMSLDELAGRYSRFLDEYPDSATYVAPIVILAAADVEDSLSSSPFAPGILFRIQHLLRTHRVVTIADRHHPFAAVELNTDGGDRDTPALVATTFWDVIDAQSDAPGATEQRRELRAALVADRDFVRPEERHVDYEQTHSEFALRLAHSEQTTFPWTPEDGIGRDVFFVVPRLDGLNGAELRLLRLAQAMTELGGDERLHLVVTDSTQLEVADAALAPFTTVTSLA